MNTKEFQKTVNSNCRDKVKDSPVKILDDLELAIEGVSEQARKIGLSGSEITGVKKRLLSEAEVKWMHCRYASLDMSFTKATRSVVYGRTVDDPERVKFLPSDCPETSSVLREDGELPVFAVVWDSLDDFENYYKENDLSNNISLTVELTHLSAGRPNKVSMSRRNVRAHVKLPDGMQPKMFTKLRRCLAYLKMFDAMVLDRGLERYQDRHRSNGNVIGVLWAPTDEAWSLTSSPPRPAGDPAILVQRDENVYLVGYYDTPDEKPIHNILREFSSGKIGKTLRSK